MIWLFSATKAAVGATILAGINYYIVPVYGAFCGGTFWGVWYLVFLGGFCALPWFPSEVARTNRLYDSLAKFKQR